MSRPAVISPVYKSIIRAVSDMIADLTTDGNFGTISYHNWEERALENTLPQHTLIGTDGFGFSENNGLWMIRFAMALSSYRDVNLLNEIELIDEIQKVWGEGQKINLLDPDTSDVISQLAISRFEVLPMAQSELRNYRTIGIELMRTSA